MRMAVVNRQLAGSACVQSHCQILNVMFTHFSEEDIRKFNSIVVTSFEVS